MEELLENWEDILQKLKRDFEIHEVSFSTWIAPLRPVSVENDTVYISGLDNDSFSLSYVEKRYLKPLEVAIGEFTGKPYKVSFISEKENKARTLKADSPTHRPPAFFNLKPNYTFEKFVVGPNNNLAHAASLAVAESPGKVYNPLFLHGGVGLGKTHLMQAIAHYILEEDPDAKVLYVTSETFTNELIESVKNNKTADFKKKYREIDVLLIDDIQFLIGKESTQEEFFHTFNALYLENKQIVLTSDKPPKEMETLEERLRTRFSEGLICDIQIPTYETKMAILSQKIDDKRKEDFSQKEFPFEVRDYIAKNINSSIRELEGAITSVNAYASLSRSPITLDLAMEALKDIINPENKYVITSDIIIETVSDHFNIPMDDLLSSKKSNNISRPRQIAMYLCRQMTQDTNQTIADKLKRKDHSTVIYGFKQIANDILTDEQLKNTIDILMKKIDPN